MDKNNFHLFLLAGQSNMAGRGIIEPGDEVPVDHILMLTKDLQWVPAAHPVHYDKPGIAAFGLGLEFAKHYLADHPGVTVGLIPAACGGSSILHWQEGTYFPDTDSHPYDDALIRTNKALETGTLKGILWHQGEADVFERAEQYEDLVTELFARFRKHYGSDLPIITGQLAFAPSCCRVAGTALVDTALEKNGSAFAPADGLTLNDDITHFDRASLVEFAKRYYKAWKQIEN